MLSISPEVEKRLKEARAISDALDEVLLYIGDSPRFRVQLEDRLNCLRLMYCQYSEDDVDERRAVTTIYPDGENPLYFDFLCVHPDRSGINGGLLLSLPEELRGVDLNRIHIAIATGRVKVESYHRWGIHT